MGKTNVKPEDFGAIKDLPDVVIYADGIHDDTDNYQLVAHGKARAILPDGRYLNEVGGVILIKRTIDYT